MTTTDPIPSDTTEQGFHDLQRFLVNTQEAIDRSVLDLGVPLRELSEADLCALIDRQVRYMEFELGQAADTIESEQSLAATGMGMVLMLNKDGSLAGTEMMTQGDLLVGTLGSVAIEPVATVESYVKFAAGTVSAEEVDPIISVVPILSGAKFHVRQEDQSVQTHDLSTYDVGVALAHQLQLSPYFSHD